MSLTGDRVAAQLRPRLCRKKTGCLCCRIRRKKCDEHKPTCNACTRNNLICSWPRPPGDVQSEASSAFAWRIKLRSGEYTPETSASSSHAGENDSEDQTKQMVAISQRTRPQQVIRPLSNHPHNILSDQGSCLLYQHFVQRTAPRLVASVPANNPLLRFVLPLATSNSMVLHAALAISGAHYCHKYGSMQYRTKTLAHCQSALQKLKQALTTWEWGDTSNTLIMLLTTLLLCQYEVSSLLRVLLIIVFLSTHRLLLEIPRALPTTTSARVANSSFMPSKVHCMETSKSCLVSFWKSILTSQS